MEESYAQYLLKKTQDDYNLIAKDFTRTRSFLPADIKKLADLAKKGERILDSGCANGRLYEALKDKDIDYFGIDFSEDLIAIAKEKYPEAKFLVSNTLNLPFPENFFDKVYSISVLHHIPSKELQLLYLKETNRVLKPNGLLILRVWNLWKRNKTLLMILRYSFLKLIKKSRLDFFDIFLPWKDSKGKIITERYFHCFRKKELELLAKKVGFKIKKIWQEGKGTKANIYLIGEK